MKSTSLLALVSSAVVLATGFSHRHDTISALLLATNLVAFVLFGLDKYLAVHEIRPRIPELVLHLFVLTGGVAGGAIGRVLFHHKTLKPVFGRACVAGITVMLGLAAI